MQRGNKNGRNVVEMFWLILTNGSKMCLFSPLFFHSRNDQNETIPRWTIFRIRHHMSVTFKFLPLCTFTPTFLCSFFPLKIAEGGSLFDKSKCNLGYVICPLIMQSFWWTIFVENFLASLHSSITFFKNWLQTIWQ